MKLEQTHDSSLIEKTVFDNKAKTLVVYFKNGAVYEYSEFDEDDYRAFEAASSKGSHFVHSIKNIFSYSKLS